MFLILHQPLAILRKLLLFTLILALHLTRQVTLSGRIKAILVLEATIAYALTMEEQITQLKLVLSTHGFPPGFKGKAKPQNNGSSSQSNAILNIAAEVPHQVPSTFPFGFTQEQYNNIIELIQQSKSNPKANSISTSSFSMTSLSFNPNAKASSHNTQPFVDSHLTPFDDITNTPHTPGPTDMTLDNSNNPFVIPLPNDNPHSDIDVSLGSATPTTDSNNHTPLITNDQTFTSLHPIHTDTNSSPQSNTQTTPTTQYATPLPDTDSNPNAIVPLRQSIRNSNPPSYLNDYHCYSAYNALHSLHPFEHHIKYPLSSVLTYNKCAPSYKHFCCTISSNTEPKTLSQANKLDCWRKAMIVELLALAENHTWDVVDLPHGDSLEDSST
ncbi:hypothetical protein KIW84_041093 [Lathyrus oleraceus]|uniref:Uncharacterized protein n=1 Tax=Pisum sativum TaxID=3888 RepID=A0A9D4X9A2_PEA|nr:hypothetical protein KIW84_041093 [Pisum sativum]